MELTRGLVSNIQRYSVNDGPGIRTTVFMKGCPLACKWCHNPESLRPKPELMLREDRCIGCGECILVCERHAISRKGEHLVTDRSKCVACGRCVAVCYADARALVGSEMTSAEVVEEVLKDKAFFLESGGGVTFSGGEPFYQPEFLLSMLRVSKSNGLHTAVDTSGHFPPDLLDKADGLVDLYLFDLKTLDDSRHRDFTGASNVLILENLRRLAKHRKNVTVRIPIVPGFNDDIDEARRLGRFVEDLPGVDEVDILPYHKSGVEKYRRLGRPYALSDAIEPSRERLEAIAAEIARHVPRVLIGG